MNSLKVSPSSTCHLAVQDEGGAGGEEQDAGQQEGEEGDAEFQYMHEDEWPAACDTQVRRRILAHCGIAMLAPMFQLCVYSPHALDLFARISVLAAAAVPMLNPVQALGAATEEQAAQLAAGLDRPEGDAAGQNSGV